MAITTAERTNILKLVVAMFNAPAGSTYLSEITSVFEANGRSLSALAQTLSTTGAYKALNPNFQTAQEFAAKFLTPYGLQSNTTAVDFIVSKFNAGVNKGQISLDAATAINGYTGTDAGILAAKAIQNNKTAVAEFYSVTKAIPQTDLAQLQAAFSGVTADPASVAAANASIEGNTGTPAFNLTTGFDSLFATAAADNITANVVQNNLGQQVNTLGSGDNLNGGGGLDTLSAKVTAGVFAGGPSASSPIQAITKSIENIKLQAVNSTIGSGTTEVYVNARDMSSISKIASNYSDANLVVQNLTTLNDQGSATRLANMTVGMEYTGNKDTRWEESDMSVYFDQDYLNRDQTFSNPSIDLRLMNEDAYDVTFPTANFRPLTSVYIDKLDITLNGVGYSLAQFIGEDRGPNGLGREIETYAQLLTAIQGAITALKAANPTVAAVQTLVANFGPDFLSDISPVLNLQRVGRSIAISADGQTNGVANTLIINPTDLVLAPAAAIRTDNGDIGNNNRFERAGNTPAVPGTDLLTIKVDLEKVGLAGSGGELVVGSMFKDSTNTWQDQYAGKGIERFNVNVSGGIDKPSSLSGLHSTGNNLREVIVKTNAAQVGTFAGLTIGNSNTDAGGTFGTPTPLGKVAPGAIANATVVFQPTAANANALKDVRLFNAADLKGDLTLFAAITGESVAKYMTLKDGAPALAATDNVSFQYTGGSGNDYINLFLSEANLAAAGTTTREDFVLNVNGGAGNDEVVVKIGTGLGLDGAGNAANWYQNSKINANMTISGGLGNDTIRKIGAGDFILNGDEGSDVIYADNSGNGFFVAPLLQKAVYVFNVADGDTLAAGNQYNFANLLSQQAATVSAVNANLTVTFKGLTSTFVIGNSAGSLTNVVITDLSVNQAIKSAINLDPVLSKLLVAEDGPGRSLVVRSLIDGQDFGTPDLTVAFGTTGALSTSQAAAVPALTLFVAPAALADGYVTTNFAQDGAGSTPVAGTAEVFSATFAGTETGGDTTVAFDGVTVTLAANAGGTAIATDYAAKYNAVPAATLVAVANAGTVTFTQKIAGARIDTVSGDFVITPVTVDAVPVTITAAAPTTQGSAAVAGVNEIVGNNSISPSDNTINGGTGNDVIVLGTTDNFANALASSNDTVVFSTGFGNDVVVNFRAGDPATVFGSDVLNFVALGGDVNALGTNFSNGAVNNLDKSVSIVTFAAGTNGTAALVAASFADSATAVTHVYVAVDTATNIGSVYSVNDLAGTAVGNVTATLVGTLDLADTVYSTLVFQNVA